MCAVGGCVNWYKAYLNGVSFNSFYLHNLNTATEILHVFETDSCN